MCPPYVYTAVEEVCLLSFSRSLLGGQLVDITGEGFGSELTQLEVSLGNYPCDLREVSDTLIRCVTSPTTTTHIIDNNA